MRTILVLLVGLVLVGCSSKNIAKNKTIINNMSDFLKVNEAVCSKYRSTDNPKQYRSNDHPPTCRIEYIYIYTSDVLVTQLL